MANKANYKKNIYKKINPTSRPISYPPGKINISRRAYITVKKEQVENTHFPDLDMIASNIPVERIMNRSMISIIRDSIAFMKRGRKK